MSEDRFRIPLSFGKGSNKSMSVACVNCNKPKWVSINTQGFICTECNHYNGNIEKCIEAMKNVEYDEPNAPHIVSEAARNHIAYREAGNVKAELFSKGITRKAVGGHNYRKILNRELGKRNIRTKV